MPDLLIKLSMLAVFFGVMIYIGLYCRRHTTDVNGFVLGGRSVGPWLTALPMAPAIFLRWSLWAMRVSLVESMASRPHGPVLAMPSWGRCWPGLFWAAGQGL